MNNIKLVSFDIFDTVLIRRCGKPDNIFLLLAMFLFPDDVAKQEAFIIWRRSCKGFTINDFYSKANAISFAPYNYQDLIDAELHIEEEQLIANNNIKNIIADLRSKGNVIKFISDMYLPSHFLEFILRREGCFVDGDEVIVSCEWKARKDNGSLYKLVRDTYKPRKWIHYGDNKRSDVCMPRRKGIKAVHVNSGYTDIEQSWVDSSFVHLDGWQLSVFAGIARASRLMVDGNSAFRFAVDYIIPVYLPFMQSVIDNARSRGIKRIYFLARNGFILNKIAEYIPHEDIELRMVFLNCYSLLLPFLRITGTDGYLTIAENHTLIGRRIDDLLTNIQLTVDDLKKMGIEFDFSVIETHEQEDRVIEAFFSNSVLLDFMRSKTDGKMAVLKDYFAQEGLLDGVPSAFVDVEWMGSTRLMLNGMLNYFGVNPIEFYYLSVHRDVLPSVYGEYIPFFKVGNINSYTRDLIENYFSASPWPATVDFRRDDNETIVPVFQNDRDYFESEIVKSNMLAVEVMLPQLMQYYFRSSLLFFWAKNALDALLSCKYKEDLSSLAQVTDVKGNKIIKKLSPAEMFKAVIKCKKTADIPLLSFCYTIGFRLTKSFKWIFSLFYN